MLVAGLAVAFAVACGESHHAPTATPAASTLTADLRRIVEAGSPGAIGVVNDGHALSLEAAGVADTGSGRALRPGDRFRAGSNTKTFVATVALQLEAEGKLSLDDTVEHWVPGILPYGDRVTLRQLLNMTGGVPDYVPGLFEKMMADPKALSRSYAPRELVAMVARKPDFPAGKGWNYSTTGYIVAGLAIERAAGHSLDRELQQRVFGPLHMRDTYLPRDTPAIRGIHSRGYGEADGKLLDVTAFNASAGWAGGGAVTTAADMVRYWRGLLGGDLLASAQLKEMKTTVTIKQGFPRRYGLGLQRMAEYPSCGILWGNGGDLPGFSSEFLNSEDGKVQAGVIVNVNPIPKAVSGEPLGVAKRSAVAAAVHHERC
jgi:D-alanyl-D-alanine carboxypeptidase